MTPKLLFILLLANIAFSAAAPQNEDNIPLENDNQFPPDSHADPDLKEGSGDDDIEIPVAGNSETVVPPLEDMEDVLAPTMVQQSDELSCPKSCTCNVEGDTFVTDCSSQELTEMPTDINTRTTTLNLQNNKLTTIPKEVSTLTNLKVLKANKNVITDLALGSVSELPELEKLILAENRFIEYPQDLKNSFTLTKLEELDLGDNDMRTELTAETFSMFKSLRSLKLATFTQELAEQICATLKGTLETVCTGSCVESYDCTHAPQDFKDDDEFLSFKSTVASDVEESVAYSNTDEKDNSTATKADTVSENQEANTNFNNTKAEDFSLRSVVDQEGTAAAGGFSVVVDIPKDATSNSESDANVNVGATTKDTNTGGVDKSVIGIVIAAMVVVVAAITIKKNWASIKKRFSSSSRTPNENTNGVNGSTPEEVPLQDKTSPA